MNEEYFSTGLSVALFLCLIILIVLLGLFFSIVIGAEVNGNVVETENGKKVVGNPITNTLTGLFSIVSVLLSFYVGVYLLGWASEELPDLINEWM